MTELETAHKRIAALEAELAAMRATGGPVAWQATYTSASGSQNVYTTSIYGLALENSENGSPTPLYPHPQQAAHAERKQLTHEQAKDLVSKYGNDPLHLVFQVEVWHGIAAQGEKT